MKIYKLRKKNLPAEVLVLKEIARQILSAGQYKRFRKHNLIISDKKRYRAGLYHRSWRENSITIGTRKRTNEKINEKWTTTIEHISITDEKSIEVFIHELGHMVWYNKKSVNHKSSRAHAKTFHNIEKRLMKNYEKIKPELPAIIKQCKKTRDSFVASFQKRTEQKQEAKERKNSIEHKLEQTRKRIKSWETKKKRAETYLKKLRRREKIYIVRLS